MIADRMDRAVFVAIVVLILAIGGVILLGNNVGVQVASYGPRDTAKGDTPVRVRFLEPMNQPSVEDHFHIEPDVSGTFRWNGPREIVFQPEAPLASGKTYTIDIASGAETETGSAELKDDLRFSFKVDLPRVVYISADRNLIMVDLNTGDAVPLIDSEFDIIDYAVDATGNLIAYTIVRDDSTSDIWVYNLNNGSSTQIIDCENAACLAPAWNADSTQIAYEREEVDELFGQVSARRVWVVDLTTARSRLFFDDTQITGRSPIYPPVGTAFAMFATNPPGILVYDFADDRQTVIDNQQGQISGFSFDGRKLMYPILVMGDVEQTFFTQLEMLNLDTQQRIAITGTPEDAIEDWGGFWRPGHPDEVAVIRTYLKESGDQQIDLLNIETGQITPLIVELDYDYDTLVWSADGNLLLLQRFSRAKQDARTEIWFYDLRSEALVMVANDGFLPGFVR